VCSVCSFGDHVIVGTFGLLKKMSFLLSENFQQIAVGPTKISAASKYFQPHEANHYACDECLKQY